MAKPPPTAPLDSFRYWARSQFIQYRDCVAYIASVDADGNAGVGTCFHVGGGVFVTGRHVLENRTGIEIGFDDDSVTLDLLQHAERIEQPYPARLNILEGPYFHRDAEVDVACFRADHIPSSQITIGGHLEDYLSQYEFVLHRTLVLGHPPVPHTDRPVIVAALGEVNAMVSLYSKKYLHYVVSTMARGGFSGGPVLVAYNELNESSGTALLGIVTDSLVADGKPPESGYMAVINVDPIYECLEDCGLLPPSQALSPDDEDA